VGGGQWAETAGRSHRRQQIHHRLSTRLSGALRIQ